MSEYVLYRENETTIQHMGDISHTPGSLRQRARGWLMSCGVALCLLPMTEGLASENAEADFRLSVRPSICVSYDSDVPCRMAMEVQWEGNATVDACLREAEEAPLHCWADSRSGSIVIEYADTEDVLYQLVDAHDQKVLAEAEVKVINRDLRSSRKRRRHVWSIL